jgi:hypothetical protein
VEEDALFEQSKSSLKLTSSEAEYNLLSLYSADVSNYSIYFLVPTYKYTTQYTSIHKHHLHHETTQEVDILSLLLFHSVSKLWSDSSVKGTL